VLLTHAISRAAKQQANTSVEIAKGTREQRVMASRPVIVQKAEPEKQIDGISLGYFSHFEVHNAGNGPAIEVEISLLNNEKTSLHSHRESFLRAGDSIKFRPFNLASLEESKTYYLACEYQSVLSLGLKTWYQTLLPFKPVKSGKQGEIYVNPDKLEFKDDVPEDERIDVFGWRSKPK